PKVCRQIRVDIGIVGEDDFPTLSVEDFVAGLALDQRGEIHVFPRETEISSISQLGKKGAQHDSVQVIYQPVSILVLKDQVARYQVAFIYECLGVATVFDHRFILEYPCGFVSDKCLIRLALDRSLSKFSGASVTTP